MNERTTPSPSSVLSVGSVVNPYLDFSTLSGTSVVNLFPPNPALTLLLQWQDHMELAARAELLIVPAALCPDQARVRLDDPF